MSAHVADNAQTRCSLIIDHSRPPTIAPDRPNVPMGGNPLSPVAPARVRVLLLPVGRIKRRRFESFVERLQTVPAVRLGDVTPDSRAGRNTFSPLAFPDGTLLYNLSTSLSPPPQAELSPYELFRQPLAILGIADAQEYEDRKQDGLIDIPDEGQSVEHSNTFEGLEAAMDAVAGRFPTALVHQLVLMDHSIAQGSSSTPKAALRVPPLAESTSTTIKTTMCDVASRILSEMAIYAETVKQWSTVITPAISQPTAPKSFSDSRPDLSRRISLRVPGLRDESPYTDHGQRSTSRPSFRDVGSPLAAASPRSDSPAIMNGPPASFDDIMKSPKPGDESKTSNKSTTAEAERASSRSLFPATSAQVSAEKERNIGKTRVGIVLGTLYLMAGRLIDAWKELLEQTARARALNDWLWHSKGLENILACMLLLGWSGHNFEIPVMIHAGTDSYGSASFKDATKDLSIIVGHYDPIATSGTLRKLGTLLPDISNTIIAGHDRASIISGEAVPQIAFSELILRLCRILAVISSARHEIGQELLGSHLSSESLAALAPAPGTKLSSGFSRFTIAETVFRAYPGPFIGLSLSEKTSVLAGIASTLSLLKLDRKHAIVTKDLMANLVPALLQARKLGAAEIGIHPAASLSLANGSVDTLGANSGPLSIKHLLEHLQSTYGIDCTVRKATEAMPGPIDESSTTENYSKLIESAITAAADNANFDAMGSLNLKIDILRACIEFCEALPDLTGIVHSIALLLRTAGSHTLVGLDSRRVHVNLSTEEQVRLVSNMSRAANAAGRAGLQEVEAQYWDDFLIRKVQFVEQEISGKLIEHSKADLQDQSIAKKSAFLHDAFAKKTAIEAETVVVARERVELVVTMQNPYDFEIEIEHIALATEGGQMDVEQHQLSIGPRRLHELNCTAVAHSTGKLIMQGCIVKVAGCRSRFFPIHHERWEAEPPLRMKDVGREVKMIQRTTASKAATLPLTYSLPLTVIHAQPRVVVEGTSLREAAMMLLEGEQQSFQVRLRNISDSTATDFVHVSFEDSVTGSLRSSLAAKEVSRADMYELESQLSQKPIFGWKRLDSAETGTISPGQTAIYEISVIGRPGLSTAKVLFDFACIGAADEQETRFFTRQISVAVSVTVNASVQLHRAEFASMPSDFSWSHNAQKPHPKKHATQVVDMASQTRPHHGRFEGLFSHMSIENGNSGTYCILLLDLRNAWPNPLHITINVREPKASTSGVEDETKDYTVQDVVYAGNVARLVLPLPRIYIQHPHAQIPALSRESQRQFVVSSSTVSPEQERASREAFWYREELLNRLSGSWSEEGTKRRGDINLRAIRLVPTMVDTLRLGDIDISYVVLSHPDDIASNTVRQQGPGRYEIQTQSFVTLRTKLYNRSDVPVRGILRLLPTIAIQTQDVALDVGRRFVWTGLLQKVLPTINPGQTVETELGFSILTSGDYEISGVVEELKPNAEPEKKTTTGGDADLDIKGLALTERRTWRANDACVLHAVDAD